MYIKLRQTLVVRVKQNVGVVRSYGKAVALYINSERCTEYCTVTGKPDGKLKVFPPSSEVVRSPTRMLHAIINDVQPGLGTETN